MKSNPLSRIVENVKRRLRSAFAGSEAKCDKQQNSSPFYTVHNRLLSKKFYRAKTTWSNLEFIPLKLCIGSAYLILGAFFHDFVKDYFVMFCFLFGVTLAITLVKWLTKMKAFGSISR